MENLKLQADIEQLKALAQHFEKLLKLTGIEMSDFPDHDTALLDKFADIAARTNIHDLNLNNLRDLYYAKKKDSIENKLVKAEKKIELQGIKSSIKETAQEVEALERSKAAAEERLIPDSVMSQQKSQLLATKQSLLDRQKDFKTPEDLNIEGIIEKVDSLEKR